MEILNFTFEDNENWEIRGYANFENVFFTVRCKEGLISCIDFPKSLDLKILFLQASSIKAYYSVW